MTFLQTMRIDMLFGSQEFYLVVGRLPIKSGESGEFACIFSLFNSNFDACFSTS